MRTIASRIRDRDENVIYAALKEAAPVYVAQGEAMCIHAMMLCGMGKEDIIKVHEEFKRVVKRREVLGQELKCADLMNNLEKRYDIRFDDLDVNFPDFEHFIKEWRK